MRPLSRLLRYLADPELRLVLCLVYDEQSLISLGLCGTCEPYMQISRSAWLCLLLKLGTNQNSISELRHPINFVLPNVPERRGNSMGAPKKGH